MLRRKPSTISGHYSNKSNNNNKSFQSINISKNNTLTSALNNANGKVMIEALKESRKVIKILQTQSIVIDSIFFHDRTLLD